MEADTRPRIVGIVSFERCGGRIFLLAFAFGTQRIFERNGSAALDTFFLSVERGIEMVFFVLDAPLTNPLLYLMERDVEFKCDVIFRHVIGADIFFHFTEKLFPFAGGAKISFIVER